MGTTDSSPNVAQTHKSEESPEILYRQIEPLLIEQHVYQLSGLRLAGSWRTEPLIARVLEPHGYWGEAALSKSVQCLESLREDDASCKPPLK